MDAVALQTLRGELLDDCRVALDAYEKATARFNRREEVAYGAFEICSHRRRAPIRPGRGFHPQGRRGTADRCLDFDDSIQQKGTKRTKASGAVKIPGVAL
jgi:hypothetical protein